MYRIRDSPVLFEEKSTDENIVRVQNSYAMQQSKQLQNL